MYPPTGESTPPYPLLRGGAPVSAPASVGPGRCPLGTRTPLAPPKGPLTHGLPQRGSHKQYPPSLTPSNPASSGHLPQRGRLSPSLREVSRPRRDGGSLPQNSAGRSPEKFSCQARLRFQNSGMKWRNFPCPHEPSLTTFELTTSYPRSRSANSAKNPLGVFQTPILLRKTVVLAAYSHPPPKFRNALCGGFFLVPTSQVSLTLNLLGQKPLPGFLHAQIAPQEKSCYTRKSKAPRGLGGVKA